MVRLVLCDMDLTLVPRGRQTVTEVALEAFRDLRALGVRVGPASGRGIHDLRTLFAESDECLDTAVASNGCIVRLDGRTIAEHPVDQEELKRVLELVAPLPDTFLTVDNEEGHIALGSSYDEVREHYRDWPGFDMLVRDELPAGPVLKANVCMPRHARDAEERHRNGALIAGLRAACPHTDFCLLGGHVADMTPRGVSKATGLLELVEAAGLSLDEVLVFGDSENDEEIMRAVPGSVAVENAIPKVRELARYHVGRCEDDSVAHALADLARAMKEGKRPRWMC